MDLSQALDRYLVQLRADGRSPHTADQYRRHVRQLDGWLAATGRSRRLDDIDHEMLALFLSGNAARCRPDGAAKRATSMNTLRTSLRSFFAYCEGAGWVAPNPARLVRRARCSPPPPRTLSDGNVRSLLRAIDAGEGPAARRDRMLVRLMLGTGLRLSSALAVRIEDIDLRRHELRVTRSKNDAPLTLPISRDVARELRAYLRSAPEGWLFPGAQGLPLTRRQAARRIAGWAEAAGLRGRASAHVFRHVFGMRVYRRSGDILVVREALGHRSLASAAIYSGLDRSRLRSALED